MRSRTEVTEWLASVDEERNYSRRTTGNPIDEDMHDQPYEYSPDYYSKWFNLANLEDVGLMGITAFIILKKPEWLRRGNTFLQNWGVWN